MTLLGISREILVGQRKFDEFSKIVILNTARLNKLNKPSRSEVPIYLP